MLKIESDFGRHHFIQKQFFGDDELIKPGSFIQST